MAGTIDRGIPRSKSLHAKTYVRLDHCAKKHPAKGGPESETSSCTTSCQQHPRRPLSRHFRLHREQSHERSSARSLLTGEVRYCTRPPIHARSGHETPDLLARSLLYVISPDPRLARFCNANHFFHRNVCASKASTCLSPNPGGTRSSLMPPASIRWRAASALTRYVAHEREVGEISLNTGNRENAISQYFNTECREL